MMPVQFASEYVYRLETASVAFGTQIAGLLTTTAECAPSEFFEGKRMVPEDAELARRGLSFPDDPDLVKRRIYYFTGEEACSGRCFNESDFERNSNDRFFIRFPKSFLANATHYPDLTPNSDAGFAVFSDHFAEQAVVPPDSIEIKMKVGTWKQICDVTIPGNNLAPYSRAAPLLVDLRQRLSAFPATHLSSKREGTTENGFVRSDSKKLILSIAEMANLSASKVKKEGNLYVLYRSGPSVDVKYPGCTFNRIIDALEVAKEMGRPIELRRPSSNMGRLLRLFGMNRN